MPEIVRGLRVVACKPRARQQLHHAALGTAEGHCFSPAPFARPAWSQTGRSFALHYCYCSRCVCRGVSCCRSAAAASMQLTHVTAMSCICGRPWVQAALQRRTAVPDISVLLAECRVHQQVDSTSAAVDASICVFRLCSIRSKCSNRDTVNTLTENLTCQQFSFTPHHLWHERTHLQAGSEGLPLICLHSLLAPQPPHLLERIC